MFDTSFPPKSGYIINNFSTLYHKEEKNERELQKNFCLPIDFLLSRIALKSIFLDFPSFFSYNEHTKQKGIIMEQSEREKKLKNARIAIFGIGGVGGYAAEMFARSGVGTLDLIDDDKVCLTNVNRQIFATGKTIGKYKTDVAEERLKDINPDIAINGYKTFYMPDTAALFDFTKYSYVVDAIDTVKGKIELVMQAISCGTPIISCMGAGNKLDASAFRAADIYSTNVCPLAKVMRCELKKRGVKSLKVIYSEEKPIVPVEDMAISCRTHCVCPPGTRKCTVRRAIPGSNAFVPSAAGILLASEVIKDILNA